MKTVWIQEALESQGTLKLRQIAFERPIYQAVMEWNTKASIEGDISMDIEHALHNLEEALADQVLFWKR